MDADLQQHVRERARGRCEYCRLPQAGSNVPFEMDRIVSRKHGGRTEGSDLSGIDSITGKLTRLFNPRRHKWDRHFRYDGPLVLGRTPIGRTTIRVLQINGEDALTLRESLRAEGLL